MRRHILTATAAAAILALSACGGGDTATSAAETEAAAENGAETTEVPTGGYDWTTIETVDEIAAMVPEDVAADGLLTNGLNASYAPAEFMAEDGTTMIGFDIDIVNAVARVMGLEAEFIQAEFASIIPAIGTKYEVGFSEFSIRPDRMEQVNMITYHETGSSWSVAAGNPSGFDPESPCGYSVGVQTGTIQDDAVTAWVERCEEEGSTLEVIRYAQQSAVTTNLIGGKFDAMYTDTSVAGYATIMTEGQTEIVGEPYDVAPVGAVTSKDAPELTAALQAALQYLMDEGILADIFASWGIEDGMLTEAVLNPSM